MRIDRSRNPMDIPAPATPDEVAAGFPVPLATLVAQDSIEESSVGTTTGTQNGELVERSASFTYKLWRNPFDHDDPANLAELDPQTAAALDRPPVVPLPDWMIAAREDLRHLHLWEAVRTTWLGEPDDFRTIEYELLHHVNHIVMNQFREERVRGEFPGEIDRPATDRDIQRHHPIVLDGEEHLGLLVDTDPHVVGLGLDLGDRFVTAAIQRDFLPYLRLEFETRSVTPPRR